MSGRIVAIIILGFMGLCEVAAIAYLLHSLQQYEQSTDAPPGFDQNLGSEAFPTQKENVNPQGDYTGGPKGWREFCKANPGEC